MKKNVCEKVVLFATLICASALLALYMQEPEPKVYEGINIEEAIESASNEMVYNAGQSAEAINQKIEERRIAEEEAVRKAEEEAARKTAEEKIEVHAAKYQSSIDLRSAGIVNWGGHRFTWYSQNVLPGGGLDIPGRHVNSAGFVCDCDGFIVAATAYGRGTTGNSPWGAWKSYDTGVSGNTVDLYTNW